MHVHAITNLGLQSGFSKVRIFRHPRLWDCHQIRTINLIFFPRTETIFIVQKRVFDFSGPDSDQLSKELLLFQIPSNFSFIIEVNKMIPSCWARNGRDIAESNLKSCFALVQIFFLILLQLPYGRTKMENTPCEGGNETWGYKMSAILLLSSSFENCEKSLLRLELKWQQNIWPKK